MNLQINGEQITLPEHVQTLSDLLCHLGFENQVVIAEINNEIIDNQKQNETKINEHDKIELVRFVGGG